MSVQIEFLQVTNKHLYKLKNYYVYIYKHTYIIYIQPFLIFDTEISTFISYYPVVPNLSLENVNAFRES